MEFMRSQTLKKSCVEMEDLKLKNRIRSAHEGRGQRSTGCRFCTWGFCLCFFLFVFLPPAEFPAPNVRGLWPMVAIKADRAIMAYCGNETGSEPS
jgi:hypothetical protein